MKIFILLLTVVAICSCNSKSKKQNNTEANVIYAESNDSTGIAVIEFEGTSHDFGQLKEGEIVSHTFHFTNTGDKNLVLLNVESSCGCTVPKYDKKPIPPGGKGKIEVEFNSSGRMGKQYKVISIISNASERMTNIRITANIKN